MRRLTTLNDINEAENGVPQLQNKRGENKKYSGENGYEKYISNRSGVALIADLAIPALADSPKIEVGVWNAIGFPPPTASPCLVIPAKIALTTTTQNIVQQWQREMALCQTITQYISKEYNNVTATNAGNSYLLKRGANNSPEKKGNEAIIVPNSNHFTYATLNLAELKAGKAYELELVVGNKLDVIGAAIVAFMNGNLVLKFGSLYNFKFGAVAFTNLTGVPNHGNIHSMNKEKDLQNLGTVADRFEHDNELVIPCPDADTIYLYIHFDNFTYDLGAEESEVERKVMKDYELKFEKVIKVDEEAEFITHIITVYDAGGKVVDEISTRFYADMEPGTYTIVYYDPYIDEEFKEVVKVIAGKITYSDGYFAEYFENAAPIINRSNLPDIENPLVIIKKMVVVK